MKKAKKYICATVFVGMVMGSSIYAPAIISEYYDRAILGKIHTEKIDSVPIGYRYELSNWERVFIFSKARENLSSIQRYTTSSLKMEVLRIERLRLENASANAPYALFANEKGPGTNELSKNNAIKTCLEEIEKLKARGILPKLFAKEAADASFEAELYLLVNIAEASKNISVWELYSLTGNIPELQFDMDAKTGKIYSFSVNVDSPVGWEALDTDIIVKNYCDYLGISAPQEYTGGDMTERTPYFKKYISKKHTGEKEEIFITIGFNPGNNSFFIRIP